MSKKLPLSLPRKIFSFLSSLKTAIPLLVITIAVTIGGSLLPTPDFFRTWWYLSLLGLNGISLLLVTILHIPMILERKGRNALIGVVATHLGILILTIGVIYGGTTGFRYEVKAIEQEMTIVPGLPFVIQLDELIVEDYDLGEVPNPDQEFVPRKRQESHLSFYKQGEPFAAAIAAPGTPARLDGITILPALWEIGWVFDLIVIDWRGNEKIVPVRPWSPSVLEVRGTPIMVHGLVDTGELATEVFTVKDGQMTSLGLVTKSTPLEVNGNPIALGEVKRYTGLTIYNRPHMPILIIGCLAMLFGLVWHFYFRYRDRRKGVAPAADQN